tara:strand:+ start:276 stop:758 length:483 start_codon:yes stop_codon:yes gene_type:complete
MTSQRDPDPFYWNAPKGKLFRPDDAAQEVLANGASCGGRLRNLANLWAKGSDLNPQQIIDMVQYPIDYYGADDWMFQVPDEELNKEENPLSAPYTEATMHYGVEGHPILAWAVSPNGGSAAAIVDAQEKSDSPYGDCKVIQGTPSEILPLSLRRKIGLSY